MACEYRHIDLIQYLLSKKANIEAINKFGVTALVAAIRRGDCEVVELLLNNGANIEARDLIQSTPLIEASIHGQAKIVEILLRRRASIEARDKVNHFYPKQNLQHQFLIPDMYYSIEWS